MSENLSFQERKNEWDSLKPVYFPKWAWHVARQHEPEKYAREHPTYKGKKVILT